LGAKSVSSSKHQKRRWQNLRDDLEAQQLPAELFNKPKRPFTEAERQGLVEQRIQEAIEAGLFDDLPGKGKPLVFDDNPYLEPGQELAFGLLKNNGFAPEWIERDKEIRRELHTARERLRRAWQGQTDEAAWQAAVSRFEESLNKLNHKIIDFNLTVPIISCQRARLRLEDEVRWVQVTDSSQLDT
jgi:DnaJ family protein C protein 28